MATRTALTYRDLEAMPEGTSRRYELYEGELVVTASPNTPHQNAVGELFVILRAHVNARGLGRVFVSPISCTSTPVDPASSPVAASTGPRRSSWRSFTEAFALVANEPAPAGRLAGDDTGALPPFDDRPIPVASLWA